MALQAMPLSGQRNRNSHRLVMPPDTVSMEKRELSILHHPLTNSLQRNLKKHQQSPNQRDFPCIRGHSCLSPAHTRRHFLEHYRPVRSRARVSTTPRALATTRTCHEPTNRRSGTRPARARAREEARRSKRDGRGGGHLHDVRRHLRERQRDVDGDRQPGNLRGRHSRGDRFRLYAAAMAAAGGAVPGPSLRSHFPSRPRPVAALPLSRARPGISLRCSLFLAGNQDKRRQDRARGAHTTRSDPIRSEATRRGDAGEGSV